MSAYLSPIGNAPQCDANGAPLSGGKIHTYVAGSVSTPATTYTTSAATVPQANPIILNSRGIPANPIWLAGGSAYKIVIADANDVVLQTIDNVQGINDPTTITAPDQWVLFAGIPTFQSTTGFAFAGDQTGTFHVGRRVRAQCAGGVVYATVSAAVFSAGSSVFTVVLDTALPLDSGISAVSYGLLSYTNSSVPRQAGELIGVQQFTAGGTYTASFGTTSVIVEVQAGGGAGGGAQITGAGQVAAGGGGGGGGFAMSRITSAFSGVTVTVGASGVGASGLVGGNGGSSSFGALLSATGGIGGAVGTAASSATVQPGALGGAGGVGSSGNLQNAAGEAGNYALYSTVPISGKGGSSHFGGGAAPVSNTVSGGVNANSTSYGAGGSGGVLIASSGTNAAGGTGAGGYVRVWEYA